MFHGNTRNKFLVLSLGLQYVISLKKEVDGLSGIWYRNNTIIGIREATPADKSDLHLNDKIVAINNRKVVNDIEIEKALKNSGSYFTLNVTRTGNIFLFISIIFPYFKFLTYMESICPIHSVLILYYFRKLLQKTKNCFKPIFTKNLVGFCIRFLQSPCQFK